MRNLLLFFIFAFTVTTPALADKFFAVTPNGAVEADFADKSETVVGKISSRCIDSGWTIVSSSQSSVTCEAPLSGTQSFVGQLLMGNAYSTPPKRYFQFNSSPGKGYTRVQASGWMELQMAFGQIKRTDFSGAEFANGMLAFMVGAGGQLPIGTTFPNHALMGVGFDVKQVGKLKGLQITSVADGSAASEAGLNVGDLVIKIAWKSVSNQNDMIDALSRATKTENYDVEFDRDGKAQKVSLRRAFRDPVTALNLATSDTSAEPANLAARPTPAPVAVSVADELAKLVKLRDQGVLTPLEFDAQKKKLLGQ